MPLKSRDTIGPKIGKGTYVFDGANVIGWVKIGKRVFIAPTTVIRADEKNSFISIDDECNVQDGVIIHALKNSSVRVGKGTSLSHGCIVHGPCNIGKDCFIGFRALVFNAKIGRGGVVMHGAIVVNVNIPPNRLVPVGTVVNSQKMANALEKVPADLKKFKNSVKGTNLKLLDKYSKKLVEDI